MGMISCISEVILGIGVLLFIGQAIGYFTSSIGVLGYLVSGALIVFGLFLNIKFGNKGEAVEDT